MEDEIVITGMSGRFPDADNVAEFWEKLCNKVDCITEEGRRWPPGICLLLETKLLFFICMKGVINETSVMKNTFIESFS